MGCTTSSSKAMICQSPNAQETNIFEQSKKSLLNNTKNDQFFYEELTKTVKQKSQFKIQEQAFTYFKTTINEQQCVTEERSILNPTQKNQIITNNKNFDYYKQSIQQLEQTIKSQQVFSEKDLELFEYHIGKGSQGSVEINFLQLANNEQVYQQNEQQFIPIATKKFDDKNQFIRESMILSQLDTSIRPILAFIGNNRLNINMELCVCNLIQFRNFIHENYLVQDQLFLSLLFDMVNKVQSILDKGIFHGDIKPENVAIAIRKGHASIVFLDFGASSWDIQDYLNYYTPAYCNEQIYKLICEEQTLSKDQIRFAEIYCVCRTIQYVMLSEKLEPFFSRQKIMQFIQAFQQQYPLTIQFLKPILLNDLDSQINDNFLSIYLQQLKKVLQNVSFDEYQLFSTSSIFSNI